MKDILLLILTFIILNSAALAILYVNCLAAKNIEKKEKGKNEN